MSESTCGGNPGWKNSIPMFEWIKDFISVGPGIRKAIRTSELMRVQVRKRIRGQRVFQEECTWSEVSVPSLFPVADGIFALAFLRCALADITDSDAGILADNRKSPLVDQSIELAREFYVRTPSLTAHVL